MTERVSAIKYNPGFIGCALSHLKCIGIAKQRDLDWVLVLEDDCLPYDVNTIYSEFKSLLPVLWKNRDKWDLFSGGCTQVSEINNFYESNTKKFVHVKGLTTHFVLYNKNTFDRILNTYDQEDKIPIDNFYRDNFKTWCPLPFLAKQSPGRSLVENAEANYDTQFATALELLTKRKSSRNSINLITSSCNPKPKVELVAYIINLPERFDRWKNVQKKWSHIFDKVVRVNGIRSPTPHAGCGLAHISAAQWSFLQNPEKPAIVLEDDIVPHPSLTREIFLTVYEEATRVKDEYDAIYLKAMCEKVVTFYKTPSKLFFDFQPTQYIFCNGFMLYSPRIARFSEEYETHLLTKKSIVPIDRLFTANLFHGYAYDRPVSWLCNTVKTILKDFGSDNQGDPKFSQNSLYINTPSVISASLKNVNPEKEATFKGKLNIRKLFSTLREKKETAPIASPITATPPTASTDLTAPNAPNPTTLSALSSPSAAPSTDLPSTDLPSTRLPSTELPLTSKDLSDTELSSGEELDIEEPENFWKLVGRENDEANVKVNCVLRYGIDDRWIEKQFVPGYYKLNNDLFGGDPAKGRIKKIERLY